MPAGKVKDNEELLDALEREVEEELGIKLTRDIYHYVDGYHIRYPEYDYRYHVYLFRVDEKPPIVLNLEENKEYVWITPVQALTLDLIPHEDDIIKWSYDL